MKINEILTEAVKQRLDPKCWPRKHKAGTKIKGGIRVNNCVPNEGVAEGLQNIEIQDDKSIVTISVGGKERFVLQPATGHKLKSYGGRAYKYWTIYDIERKKDRFNPNIGMMSKNQAIAYVNKIIQHEEDTAKEKQGVAEGTSPKLSAAPIKIGSIYRMKVNGSQTYGKVASINDDRGTVRLRRLNKDGSPYEGAGPDKDSDGRWIQQYHFHVTTPDNLGKRFQMDNMYGELVPYGTAKIPGTEPIGEDKRPEETSPKLSVSKADVVSVQGVAEGTEKVNPLTKLTNAVISFYKPVVDQIEPGAVDDYDKQAKELLNQAPDPNIRSRMREIFQKGQKDPMIQGGVITAIAAILTGGLLSSASRMGLSPAQTNILLQAVLNTVIPTIIARINNKSWSDTIKYTLASVGVGMTAAATLSEKRVTEGLSIDVPNEQWLQDKIDYAKSKGRDEWGAPFFGTTTAYVRPNPQVSVVRLEMLKGMRNEQNNVRKKDLEWLMATMEKTGKLPLTDQGEEYPPFVMVAYNGEAWVNEGNHRIMAAYRLGWKKMPVEIRYFDGGERVEDGIMYPGKIGL